MALEGGSGVVGDWRMQVARDAYQRSRPRIEDEQDYVKRDALAASLSLPRRKAWSRMGTGDLWMEE